MSKGTISGIAAQIMKVLYLILYESALFDTLRVKHNLMIFKLNYCLKTAVLKTNGGKYSL